MMKKFKITALCAITAVALLTFVGCGRTEDNNNNNGTDAPYEDDVNNGNDVNNGTDMNNGIDNIGDDINNGIDNIGDDINNGIDNIEDGINNGIDNIQDGIDDMDGTHPNDTQDNTQNNTQNGTTNDMSGGTSSLRDAGQNLVNSIQEAGAAIRDGINRITNNETR